MRGATVNVSGVCTVTNVQINQAGTWANCELIEAASSSESSSGLNKELAPLRASVRIPDGVSPPSEGSLLDIRSGVLNRPINKYNDKDTPFWTLTIFQWRELGTSINNGSKPGTAESVTAKPTVNRPVFDDDNSTDSWDGDVPF